MNAPSSHQPLSSDWRAWPILPNRKPRRGFDPFGFMSYRKDMSQERFLIDGVGEHHDAICAAIAAALLPMSADPNVRLGRFRIRNGPTTTATIRVEYREDKWTIFTADLWTSTSMDSMLIVTEHWSYMSGSWFGRHLYRHAGSSAIDVILECLLGGLFRLIGGGVATFGFLMLFSTIAQVAEETFFKFKDSHPGLRLLFILAGVSIQLAIIGVTFAPYFLRNTTAESSLEAQRQFVVRIRQCIFSAIAGLGIPSSAVHHSTN